MANNASNVVIGSNGQVYVGATTETAPDDVGTAIGGGFVELGFVSEDGATLTEGKDITDINAWQSFYPIRRVITARNVTLAFALREWSKANIEFALGGTVTAAGGGEFVYVPPSPDVIDERSIVLDWQDGDKSYRLYILVDLCPENVEVNLTRSAAADLPITFAATDPGSDVSGPLDIYTLFTDDTAFAAVGS